VTAPLAIVVYEHLVLGNQLGNKLRDMGYRVTMLNEPPKVLEIAEREKPLVVLLDLDCKAAGAVALIGQLKNSTGTKHLPVLCFTSHDDKKRQEAAVAAGASLVAGDQAILHQFPQLLDQVLQVE
jgi:CheY-like chemotaxis protein